MTTKLLARPLRFQTLISFQPTLTRWSIGRALTASMPETFLTIPPLSFPFFLFFSFLFSGV
jgi:hypothetical protein